MCDECQIKLYENTVQVVDAAAHTAFQKNILNQYLRKCLNARCHFLVFFEKIDAVFEYSNCHRDQRFTGEGKKTVGLVQMNNGRMCQSYSVSYKRNYFVFFWVNHISKTIEVVK